MCATNGHALALCAMSTPISNNKNTSPGTGVPGPSRGVDPERIRSDVDALLVSLGQLDQDPNDQHGAGVIPHKAQLLEQAHEVLVQALASVDRV